MCHIWYFQMWSCDIYSRVMWHCDIYVMWSYIVYWCIVYCAWCVIWHVVMCHMSCGDVPYVMWWCILCHIGLFVVIYLIKYGHIFWVVLSTEVALWYCIYNVMCHIVSHVIYGIFKCGHVTYHIVSRCDTVIYYYIFTNYDELMFLIWWCDVVEMVMWHNMSDSFVSYDIVNKIGSITSLLYHVINILPLH